MKKILVTGGAGFIGSHLCEDLVRHGYAVIVVDNFDPMYPRAQKDRNLSWLLKQKNFKLIEADVRDRKRMERIFSKYKFDHVFHLAGRGGIPQSKVNPYFYLDDILVGTLVMLECCAQYHVGMMVNASSSSVYAQTEGKPSWEAADTDQPGSVYAACKKSSELLCHAYHVMYGLGAINVRFFSVYGPRGRHDMIIYKFTKKILSGEPILNIQPDPQRDFTYVSDVIDGLRATLKLPKSTYAVVNLGRGRPVAVSESIRLLEKELGTKAIMGKRVKPPPSDMAITNANSAFAQKLLHWKPKVRLEEGIKKFVEWYRSNPQFTSD